MVTIMRRIGAIFYFYSVFKVITLFYLVLVYLTHIYLTFFYPTLFYLTFLSFALLKLCRSVPFFIVSTLLVSYYRLPVACI